MGPPWSGAAGEARQRAMRLGGPVFLGAQPSGAPDDSWVACPPRGRAVERAGGFSPFAGCFVASVALAPALFQAGLPHAYPHAQHHGVQQRLGKHA